MLNASLTDVHFKKINESERSSNKSSRISYILNRVSSNNNNNSKLRSYRCNYLSILNEN